ncbi:transposase [Asaia krungthepensis]|uniref:transposase n=1 Tax=Asaia krungthepensis TaxID=220990 RepID=UPI0035F04B4E
MIAEELGRVDKRPIGLGRDLFQFLPVGYGQREQGWARGDLTDHEWLLIGLLLRPERGRWPRPAGDKRLFLNGMLYVLRTGCPWRDMHERDGKWNSVYVRFWRWAE